MDPDMQLFLKELLVIAWYLGGVTVSFLSTTILLDFVKRNPEYTGAVRAVVYGFSVVMAVLYTCCFAGPPLYRMWKKKRDKKKEEDKEDLPEEETELLGYTAI